MSLQGRNCWGRVCIKSNWPVVILPKTNWKTNFARTICRRTYVNTKCTEKNVPVLTGSFLQFLLSYIHLFLSWRWTTLWTIKWNNTLATLYHALPLWTILAQKQPLNNTDHVNRVRNCVASSEAYKCARSVVFHCWQIRAFTMGKTCSFHAVNNRVPRGISWRYPPPNFILRSWICLEKRSNEVFFIILLCISTTDLIYCNPLLNVFFRDFDPTAGRYLFEQHSLLYLPPPRVILVWIPSSLHASMITVFAYKKVKMANKRPQRAWASPHSSWP